MAVSRTVRSPKSDRHARTKVVGNWLVFLAALGVLIIGILLLFIVSRGKPVAAAFTRVGGATRVETALDAAHFWLTPPRHVVTTKADASQQVMLWAAQCAMVRDVPLLFISSDPKRQRLVDVATRNWQEIANAKGRARFRIPIRSKHDLTRCLAKGDPADVNGLSTLKGSLLRLTIVPAQRQLAPVVVFAAAIEPRDPPDVAVGLALAAHMATAHRKVSLVVVPRYLEADPGLEVQLQSQRELVTGGVVLGQTPTLPEDTRVLLRQLLTSTDRQSVLDQVQANLGSVGPLIAALFALVGFGAVARVTPEIMPQVADLGHWLFENTSNLVKNTPGIVKSIWKVGGIIAMRVKPKGTGTSELVAEPTPEIATMLAVLRHDQNVTVWLCSGWKIAGTTANPVGNLEVLHLKSATLKQQGDDSVADSVFVPVKDIQLIGVDVKQKQPSN